MIFNKQEKSIEKVEQWLNAEAAKPTVTIFKSTLDELLEEMDILIDENEKLETETKQWISKYKKAKQTIVRLKRELQSKEKCIVFLAICILFFLAK